MQPKHRHTEKIPIRSDRSSSKKIKSQGQGKQLKPVSSETKKEVINLQIEQKKSARLEYFEETKESKETPINSKSGTPDLENKSKPELDLLKGNHELGKKYSR